MRFQKQHLYSHYPFSLIDFGKCRQKTWIRPFVAGNSKLRIQSSHHIYIQASKACKQVYVYVLIVCSTSLSAVWCWNFHFEVLWCLYGKCSLLYHDFVWKYCPDGNILSRSTKKNILLLYLHRVQYLHFIYFVYIHKTIWPDGLTYNQRSTETVIATNLKFVGRLRYIL